MQTVRSRYPRMGEVVHVRTICAVLETGCGSTEPDRRGEAGGDLACHCPMVTDVPLET